MLSSGGTVFQSRWEAEEADHAAHRAKQEKIKELKKRNWEKREQVME